MDKVVEGVVFHKARFLRTTCKKCNKPLSLEQVKSRIKHCSKLCRKSRQPKRKIKHIINDVWEFDDYGPLEWDHGDNGCL